MADNLPIENGKIILDGERYLALIKCENACQSIATLWPLPPNCADHRMVIGVNDGKNRAILLDAALEISRNALNLPHPPREEKHGK